MKSKKESAFAIFTISLEMFKSDTYFDLTTWRSSNLQKNK